MTDHALGLRLRQLLLSPAAAGEPPDGRRLQALVGDLCRHEQQDLLPPLRHLVLAPAFQSALRSVPPLGDRRCRPRLLEELRLVFTPRLCQRMEAVVDGLLGLEPSATAAEALSASAWASASVSAAAPASASPPVSAAGAAGEVARGANPGAEAARERRLPPRRGIQPLPLALAMGASVALGMGGAWLWWESAGLPPLTAPGPSDPAVPAPAVPTEPPSTNPTTTVDPFAVGNEASSPTDDAAPSAVPPSSGASPSDSPSATPSPATSPSSAAPLPGSAASGSGAPGGAAAGAAGALQPPPLPPLSAPRGTAFGAGGAGAEAGREQALQKAAAAQLQGLYSSLSRQDFAAARGYFSPAVADQFDPAFFRQFRQVEVSQLEPVGRSATTLTLRGVVRFAYPDGTSQQESRRFTFSTLDNPPRVISSAFGAVLKPRSAGR